MIQVRRGDEQWNQDAHISREQRFLDTSFSRSKYKEGLSGRLSKGRLKQTRATTEILNKMITCGTGMPMITQHSVASKSSDPFKHPAKTVVWNNRIVFRASSDTLNCSCTFSVKYTFGSPALERSTRGKDNRPQPIRRA